MAAMLYATSNKAVRTHGNHILLGFSIFRMKSDPQGTVLIQNIVSGNVLIIIIAWICVFL